MCLRPAQFARAIWEVDLDQLVARGIRGIILDLDNTIAYWNDRQVRPEARAWIAEARRRGLELCLLSNSFRSARVVAVAEELGIHCVRRGCKPFASGYRRAIAAMGASPQTTCAIGDQIFTDILGANRAGLTSILVEPLSRRESPHTRLVRAVERALRKRWGAEREEIGITRE